MAKVITAVKLKDAGEKGVEISYDIFTDNGKEGDDKKGRKAVPHDDFVKAMNGLKTTCC